MLRKEIIRLELNPIPIITDLNIINELLNIEESNKQAFINGIYFQEIIINSEFDINNKTSYHYKHRFYKINESGEKIISYEKITSKIYQIFIWKINSQKVLCHHILNLNDKVIFQRTKIEDRR